MITQLTRSWWLLALRGMIPVLLALAIFVRLDITLAATGLVFGAFALADGLMVEGERQSAWDNLIEREMMRVR